MIRSLERIVFWIFMIMLGYHLISGDLEIIYNFFNPIVSLFSNLWKMIKFIYNFLN